MLKSYKHFITTTKIRMTWSPLNLVLKCNIGSTKQLGTSLSCVTMLEDISSAVSKAKDYASSTEC